MTDNRISQRLLVFILLVIFFGVAIYLRVVLPHERLFVDDIIKFSTYDAYYYLRQIDSFVYNFPHLNSFDPYLNYPTGSLLGPMNFFVYLLGGIIWLTGLGSPSTHLVNTISAYFPAVLGALTIIPLYFIGKALFDRRVGIIAAALVAVLPGEFLGRSMLGATDRDTLEVILTSLTMLFLIMAVKSAREKQLTFRRLQTQNLSVMTVPIIYSLLSGILLGLSVLTWRGTFLFVLIILTYIVIRSILDHLKHESFDYLGFVGIVTFIVALLIFGVMSRNQLYSVALAISLLLLPVLSGLAWLLMRRNIKAFYYPVAVLGIGLFGLAIFYVISPALFKLMLDQFSVFIPSQSELTILEMRPILFPTGSFTLSTIWHNYTTGSLLSIISLCILIYLFFRRSEKVSVLFVVWSLMILIATLVLRRMAIFFAINVALLTSYLAVIIYYVVRLILNFVTGRGTDYIPFRLLEFTGLKATADKPLAMPSRVITTGDYYEVLGIPINASRKQIKKEYRKLVSKYQSGKDLTDKDEERFRQITEAYAVLSDPHKRASYDRSEHNMAMERRDKTKLRKRGGFHITTNRINTAVAGLIIFFLIIFPNFTEVDTVIDQTTSLTYSDAWYGSLNWLKDNTQEPFGDASFYYASYQTPFHYPDTAYGVAAWWDYGYWITRIGHRLPNCTPGGGDREAVARLFTAQDEATANELTDKLNSRYIIIDGATVTGKFHAVATYAGFSREQFFDVYYLPAADGLRPTMYYYPDYYKSLAVRLYYFDGKKTTPDSTQVISYREKMSQGGVPYKEILNSESFPTFEEATAFVSKQTLGNYRIASSDPTMSSLPLDSLEHYKLVHSSDKSIPAISGTIGSSPPVKIFEYIR